ncbi:hypothetical protein AKJ57_00125 [candidate division MSBL1 archaeon SCGC-AAA259A05]|uniref:HEPN domain-containing protein n=1 Tax=candidate division MSBL1 archaeon SCGC-AAA259A05 TaxID=1698259 RepID=A0A133UC27_9EURY|nr:hypothetical protein AKJ57_00125 [candidate division MSBL1 archaeon SCGC-AAA259A05]
MKEHLKDAKAWLGSTRENLESNPRVSMAMAAHSVIKSLDALFEEKLGETPSRHDNATDFFRRLLREGEIDPKYSKYSNELTALLQKKSSAEYHAAYVSKSEARKWCRFAEKIFEMSREILS